MTTQQLSQLGDYIFTIYFEGHMEEDNGYVETSVSDLTIDEFREAHIKSDKTYVLNIPPMISINSTSEILNTSYLTKLSENKKTIKK